MKILLSFLFLLFTACSFCQQIPDMTTEKGFEDYQKMKFEKMSGKEYPRFSIKLPDGSTFSNADLSNHTVFINFWFEACHPCMTEMDALNDLYTKFSKNPDFKFVSFTFDPDSTIQKMVKQLNIKYKVVHIDRTECYRLNFQSGFPSSFILDKKGLIRHFKMGGAIDKDHASTDVITEFYPKITALL